MVPAVSTGSRLDAISVKAAAGELTSAEGYALMALPDDGLAELLAAAGQLRDDVHGRIVTYSRKVFLPLTNLCRDTCGYCTFVRQPDDPLAHTMLTEEVLSVASE